MSIITISRPMMLAIDCNWDIDWRGQSAGGNNAGGAQIVYNRFPRWIGSPTLRLGDDQVNQWRAVRAAAQGRANVFRVPMIDHGDVEYFEGIPFDNGETFSTGQGMAYAPFVSTVAAAAAGASDILVSEGDETVRVGQFISHDDWPALVTWRTEEGANVRLGIQMPLRRAIPAAAEIQLRAHGLFRATDDTMGNPAIGLVRFSEPQLSFEEWLNR